MIVIAVSVSGSSREIDFADDRSFLIRDIAHLLRDINSMIDRSELQRLFFLQGGRNMNRKKRVANTEELYEDLLDTYSLAERKYERKPNGERYIFLYYVIRSAPA